MQWSKEWQMIVVFRRQSLYDVDKVRWKTPWLEDLYKRTVSSSTGDKKQCVC